MDEKFGDRTSVKNALFLINDNERILKDGFGCLALPRGVSSICIWLHFSYSFEYGISICPRLALWFSRTLTDDGELSASTMFGGTAMRERRHSQMTSALRGEGRGVVGQLLTKVREAA